MLSSRTLPRWAAEYGDIRHNLNFVHSLDALAAHVYYASNGAAPGRDDLEYRSELAKQHSEFALLRDIATRYFLIHRFIAASDPCGPARRK